MSGLSCSFLAIFSSKYCLGVVGASAMAVSRLVGATEWSFIQRRRSLAVAAVEHEVLAGELPHVDVRPPMADALVARDADPAAVPVRPGLHRAIGDRSGRHVDHAKSTLRRSPDAARRRVDQLVPRVMPEMEMVVARRELVQPVVRGEVSVG